MFRGSGVGGGTRGASGSQRSRPVSESESGCRVQGWGFRV